MESQNINNALMGNMGSTYDGSLCDRHLGTNQIVVVRITTRNGPDNHLTQETACTNKWVRWVKAFL